MVAYNTITPNREGTDYVASRLVAAGELYGDDVIRLLDDARLDKPEIDVLDEDDMARDLIPPPSPAGRPSGDAEAERERAREREEAPPQQRAACGTADRGRPGHRRRRRHQGRRGAAGRARREPVPLALRAACWAR